MESSPRPVSSDSYDSGDGQYTHDEDTQSNFDQFAYGASDTTVNDLPETRHGPSRSFSRGDVTFERSMSRKSLTAEASKNFKVVIRVRPPLPRELDGGFVNCVRFESDRMISISESFGREEQGNDAFDPSLYATHQFTFDNVYSPQADQKMVYETTARDAVLSTLQGYNATIIAYGQTGTGKTYTMEGFTRANQPGIIPRSIEEIFSYIQHTVNARTKFLVRASFLQIYNEVISDLLKPERTNLTIREDKKKGVFVEGLSEWVVRSPQEIFGLMQRGAAVRATGSTRMNEVSSRSHAVFMVIVEQSETTQLEEVDGTQSSRFHQSFKIGKLNLVDLAGSERVRLTGATGRRLEESKKINQSLAALGNVIAALTDPTRAHIPYRDSKLTRILEDSLGGNCKTTMMAMISPALEAFNENLSTLKFANRAKNIKNDPRINEDLDQKALLRKYERELKKLRSELDERSRNVVDKRKLLELEEEKRRAEEDKLAALVALEKRSKEFMQEKEEKRRLEERIVSMQSQLLVGGHNLADTPAFRTALQQEHHRIRKEYETRLQELETERQSIEEDKAQVDRYKQLLLKQRDIMIALTARLNERDESILALQEELDAYDRHQRMMEDILDQKTATLIHWQRVAMEANPDLRELAQGQLDGEIPIPVHQTQPSAATLLQTRDTGTPIPPQMSSSAVPTPTARLPPVAERRYAPFHAENDVIVDSQRYSQTPAPLLSGDEKIHELQSLLEAKAKDNDQLAKELEEVQAEKVSLEYLLREKLEKMVQTEIEERINTYRREVEQWKANHSLAEERRRLSEYMLELAKLNSENPEFHERIQQILQRERELIQQQNNEHVTKLQAELQTKQESVAAAQAEVAKLRSEMSRIKVKSDEQGDAEQLWKRVQLAEKEVELLKAKQHSNSPVDADSQARIKQLEARLDHMKQQHERFRQDMHRSLDLKTQEIQHLEETKQRLQRDLDDRRHHYPNTENTDSSELEVLRSQAETNAKERAALRTIMESKIKSLVDNVMRIVADSSSEPSALVPSHSKLHRELSALQKLVNASIVALKNSDLQSSQTIKSTQSVPAPARISAAPATGTLSTPQPSAGAGSLNRYATLPSGYSSGAFTSPQRQSSTGSYALTSGGRAPTPTKNQSHIDLLIQQKRLEMQMHQQR